MSSDEPVRVEVAQRFAVGLRDGSIARSARDCAYLARDSA